ncbi:MAG: 3-isopropylmalate dehydratase [Desulfobacterales bacterium]
MEEVISGRIWKFGHNVDTDAMAPWKMMSAGWKERKSSVLHIRPGFSEQVEPGDVVVAGRNWGCGSSREQAAENMKLLGIAAIVAESFGRIFFRNALAIALPCIVCAECSRAFEEGDRIAVHLKEARIDNLTRKTTLQGQPYTPEMLSIIKKGGLVNMLKERMTQKTPQA